MKKTVIISRIWIGTIGLCCAKEGGAAQLVAYRFSGAAGNETSYASEELHANTRVSEFSRGSGLGASSASNAFSARSWSTGGLDADDYFTFSIEPEPGYSLRLDAIELDERRSASGILEWSIRSSLDGFAFDLSPGPVVLTDNVSMRFDQHFGLDEDVFGGLVDSVEFRIFGYQAESTLGTWRVDNVEVFGGVTAVPEPKDWGMVVAISLVSVGMIRRRRQKTKRGIPSGEVRG